MGISEYTETVLQEFYSHYSAQGLKALAQREGWWDKLDIRGTPDLGEHLYKMHILDGIRRYLMKELWGAIADITNLNQRMVKE